jgi:hypothetical protein
VPGAILSEFRSKGEQKEVGSGRFPYGIRAPRIVEGDRDMNHLDYGKAAKTE